MQNYQDRYNVSFNSFADIYACHAYLSEESNWRKCKVKDLKVEPLVKPSPLLGEYGRYASGVSEAAIDDTAENTGLAVNVNGDLYPLRDTAYKTLLDRAKINGTVLPKLSKNVLSDILNECLSISESDALVLIRDEKISAIHSGDEKDYSVLPIERLLDSVQYKLNERFPGNVFEGGYSDHSITTAMWNMPNQKDELIGAYTRLIKSQGMTALADKLVPAIRFITSDTGVASAKVSAFLSDGSMLIHIGSCIAVEHRNGKTVDNFKDSLDMLFAQFGDNVKKLMELVNIPLMYPVNAMTRICKKLAMPKKAATMAIKQFADTCNPGVVVSAHDVFYAMQEIPFLLKCDNVPESKVVAVEENMARVLHLNWDEFDLATEVSY